MKCGLLAALAFASCTSRSDLGDGFHLYKSDRDDVRVGYCFNDCDKSSITVVPNRVVEVAHDAEWILARTEGGAPGYWVVDKGVGEFCYDCGFSDTLLAHVRGPLGATEFEAALQEKGIELSFGE